MPTVASLKKALQGVIAPGNDAEFLRLLTEADLRLVESGKYRWTRGRTTLTPTDGIIVLPANYASIIGARVGKEAKVIWDESFEFTPNGYGEVPIDGSESLMLVDQGLNEDDLRYYKVAGHLNADTEVTALCHFAPFTLYDPEMDDSDVPEDAVNYTRCPDQGALKLMMLGITLEEQNDLGGSSGYMAKAANRLESQERAARGGSKQVFNIRPNGPGVRRRTRSFR
jgi:hypothetical protein